MRCPYCAEGIRDEAVICGFCRRDLVLFRALNERLTKVEDNVAELHSLLADSVSRPNYPGQDLPLRRPTLSEAARALLLSVCLALFLFGLTWLPDVSITASRILYLLSLSAPPFFAGWWLRRGSPSPWRSHSPYALLGLIAGLVSFLGMFILDRLCRGGWNPGWLVFFASYLAFGASLFWLGSAAPSRMNSTHGLAYQNDGRAIGEGYKLLPQLVSVIHDLVPLLTLIVSAWLAYKFKLPAPTPTK